MRISLLPLTLILVILPGGIASAAFLEDYAGTPTEKGLKAIVDYCESNPNGNVSSLIDSEKISGYYLGYTCDRASTDKAWLEGNHSDSNTTINTLH
jgi:hypothetical protein